MAVGIEPLAVVYTEYTGHPLSHIHSYITALTSTEAQAESDIFYI
jgi:hypothetical protein